MYKFIVVYRNNDDFEGGYVECEACEKEVEEVWFVFPRGDKIKPFVLCESCLSDMQKSIEEA